MLKLIRLDIDSYGESCMMHQILGVYVSAAIRKAQQ
jgi:hypothetical protein